jgi:hypothetical protein
MYWWFSVFIEIYCGIILLHIYSFSQYIKVLHHKIWLQNMILNMTCETLY